MAQTVTSLRPGETTIGSAAGGGLMTSLGNIYYSPQTPATPTAASMQNKPYAQQITTQNQNPGGGSVNLKDPNNKPGGDYWWDAAEGWKKNQPSAPSGPSDQELDQAFNPLLDYLNQAEGALRADYPTYGQEINRSYDTSKQQLTQGLQRGQQAVDTQLDTGNKQKLDVISEARRMFNELQMANQQRFGGASSAGQAASELQGREFQRGTAKAQQQFTQLQQELGAKKIEMDQNYQLSLQQLDDKKVSALNEVNRQFQEKLMQINQQRANTSAEKANRRLQALQDYRNQTYQVQLQNYQMLQQLDMMKAQSQIELDNYAKQLQMSGNGASSAFNSFSSGVQTPEYSTVGGIGPSTQTALTGQISSQKDEQQPTGMILQAQNDPLSKFQSWLGF